MPRGKSVPKRSILPDPRFNNDLIAKFMNFVMRDGKKTIAMNIVYSCFDMMKEKKGEEPVALFNQVMEILRPQVEVRSRRVGGANYQVPLPVSGNRQNALAFRWLIEAARARKERTMQERLAGEMLDVLAGVGAAMKKKEDVNRMAEANKAFAHFARFVSK
jgi:small subunit ribosomal protein S7